MTTEQNGISRRSFLTTASGLAVGVGLARLPGTAIAADTPPPLPFPYALYALDVEEIRERAYALNYLAAPVGGGGCGHAAAQALIDALAATDVGSSAVLVSPNPWATLPRGLYKYAAGGVAGWGTICGALNGTIAVMGMLGVHGTLGNALVDYFANEPLPTGKLIGYDAAGTVTKAVDVGSSVSHSPLCHNSVSNWGATVGVSLSDPKKGNRCAQLVGDIAARAVELLNEYFLERRTPPAWQPPDSYATCYNCHTQKDMIPSQQGKMECQACHTVPGGHGSWKRNKGPPR